jgi:hypothetical protein
MKWSCSGWIVGALFTGWLVSLTPVAAAGQPAATTRQASLAKLDKPWPDANDLRKRRESAEARPLFRSDTPLEFKLVADFKAVQRDRDDKSLKTFPATLIVAREGDANETDSISLNIRTRGHTRRRPATCGFAPLRLEFPTEAKKTLFDGQRSLKLGVHCRDVHEYEQYVLREYLVYKIFNLLTPRSFRVRLARATYVDQATQKPVGSHYALFIEDDDDVARRMEGRIADLLKITFRGVDPETIRLLTIFAYMIGNTDMSMYVLHNIRLVQTPAGTLYPVPYDFDYSGLVNARYAIPDKQFGIASVRERLYRGPCATQAQLEPFFVKFRAVKADVMALYDSVPDLDEKYRRSARSYLEGFYRIIDKPGDVKRAFVDGCDRAGM